MAPFSPHYGDFRDMNASFRQSEKKTFLDVSPLIMIE